MIPNDWNSRSSHSENNPNHKALCKMFSHTVIEENNVSEASEMYENRTTEQIILVMQFCLNC